MISSKRLLTPEEKAEEQSRKACKVEICDIIAAKNPIVVEVELSPKVTFKNGKATKATVNWGGRLGAAVDLPLLYAGTGVGNSADVLGPEVVEMVNHFAVKGCA